MPTEQELISNIETQMGIPLEHQTKIAQDTVAPPPIPNLPKTAEEAASQNPVLDRLKKKWGIKKESYVQAPWEDQVFTFRYVNRDMMGFVHAVADNMGEPGSTQHYQAMAACFVGMAIAAIDGEPLWKILGYEPTNATHVQELKENPLHPPTEVLRATALKFFEWLESDAKRNLADNLQNLYYKYVEPEVMVGSTVSAINELPYKYQCPIETCNFTHASNEPKQMFCLWHGMEMGRMADMEEQKFPLP